MNLREWRKERRAFLPPRKWKQGREHTGSRIYLRETEINEGRGKRERGVGGKGVLNGLGKMAVGGGVSPKPKTLLVDADLNFEEIEITLIFLRFMPEGRLRKYLWDHQNAISLSTSSFAEQFFGKSKTTRLCCFRIILDSKLMADPSHRLFLTHSIFSRLRCWRV